MKHFYREILPGINLRVVQTDRFKTACFSASFLMPLNVSDAAKNALIPQVLRRGTRTLPDMMRISAALNEQYGARIEPRVRKYGNIQTTGLICDMVAPECVPDGAALLADTLTLALEMLLDPATVGDSFVPEYVTSERENLIDLRRSEINDKLGFAYRSAVGALYHDSGFGAHEFGECDALEAIDARGLYLHYRERMLRAPLELFFCGNASFEQVEAALRPSLVRLGREEEGGATPLGKPNQPQAQELCVHYDVNQANLLLGLYPPVRAGSVEQPAMHVLSTVLGGGTASKLFLHVREEKSLCYYTGAKYDKYLQTVFLYSGVDPARVEEARGEMLRQLMACQDGDVTETELTVAKRNILDDLKTVADSALGLESYWLGESVMGLSRELALRMERIRAVTVDDVVRAARGMINCMTFVLTGEEEQYVRKSLPENS